MYVGNGQGEDEATTCDGPTEDDLPDVEHGYQYPATTNNECDIDHKKSLTIIYDCETTGLSVYREHITEIAAKVVNPPVPLSNPCFSSLVRSGRNISVSGKIYLLIITKIKNYLCDYSFQAQWDYNSSIETGEASLSSSAKFFRVGCYSCQKCKPSYT